MWIVLGIISGYIFIGGIMWVGIAYYLGAGNDLKLIRTSESQDAAIWFGAIFWPIAIIVMASFSFGKYLGENFFSKLGADKVSTDQVNRADVSAFNPKGSVD